MPLVHINLAKGKSPEYRRAVGDVVYEAMLSTIGVPKDDRFQLFSEYEPGSFSVHSTYLGIKRSVDWLIVEITLRKGRTVDMKRAFYKAIADGLHERLGARREDVFITLRENTNEDWSFGNGVAQYVD